MLGFHAIERDQQLQWHLLLPLLAEPHNPIRQKTVRRNVQPEWSEMTLRQVRDLKQIRSSEGFAAAQPHQVESRQLAKDLFDFVEGQIFRRRFLPTVAHDAPGIAGETHDVREEPRLSNLEPPTRSHTGESSKDSKQFHAMTGSGRAGTFMSTGDRR
jgi:hypothetical protein